MKSILKKLINKETVTYLIFGVLTTVVNFAVFKGFDMLFTKTVSVDLVLLTNIIAWVVSVAFAFVTNKLFVFESKSWQGNVLRKELPSFVSARLFSLGVEELGLLIFIKWLGFDSFVLEVLPDFAIGGKMLTKIGLSVIIVVMNYVFSKFVIFNKNGKDEA